MNYDYGQVVLVPFPFTDLSTQKQRPALIISNKSYNLEHSDVVLMAITSKSSQSSFDVQLTSWKEAGLISPSAAKTGK